MWVQTCLNEILSKPVGINAVRQRQAGEEVGGAGTDERGDHAGRTGLPVTVLSGTGLRGDHPHAFEHHAGFLGDDLDEFCLRNAWLIIRYMPGFPIGSIAFTEHDERASEIFHIRNAV